MQVHGPITKDFATGKLGKLKFKKGAFLLRQSPDTHGKVNNHCLLSVNFYQNVDK